jgi:putative redox protein
MRNVQVALEAETGFATRVTIGEHQHRIDEPVSLGGTDTGPTPTETLLAALGACEAITLRMYAGRKGWPLRDARVTLNAATIDGVFVITRHLELVGDLDEDQLTRLREIANKCPVQKAITGEVRVVDAVTA